MQTQAKPETEFEAFVREEKPHWERLIASLIADIADDYRAPDSDEDDAPSMQITIACNSDLETWGWQSGDNSHTGGAYGFQHWAVLTAYRDSDPRELADEAANQLGDMIYS